MGNRITRVTLEAVISGYVRSVKTAGADTDELRAKADKFARGKYEATLGVDDAKAKRDLSALEKQLAAYGKLAPKAFLALADDEAKRRLIDITERLDRLGAKVTDARVEVQDADSQSKLSRLEASLLAIGAKTADPAIDLKGIATAEAQLGMLDAKLDAIGRKHETAVVDVEVHGAATAVTSKAGTGVLADSLMALGPAVVPIAAAATGAVGALGAAMLATAGAGGILGLAIGGQISQMKKQKEAITSAQKSLAGMTVGTAAYRQKLAQVNAMQKQFTTQFGPAASALARFQSSWKGFLGDTSGTSNTVIAKALNLAGSMLPKLEGIVTAAGGSVSQLLTDLGRFSKGPEMRLFLNFLQVEGPGAITAFASILGNFGKGLLSLLMAFTPLSHGFMSGFQGMSKSFADWAAQVGQSGGFQSFVKYVQTEGPKVLELLGAFGKAFIAISTAAAPVGAALIPLLTTFLNLVTKIADSPLGPVIFGAVAAFGALNRVLSIGAGKGLMSALDGMPKKMIAARAASLGLGLGLAELNNHISDSHDVAKGFLSILSGAAMGAAFGPWGAAAGALGGALSTIGTGTHLAAVDVSGFTDTLNKNTGAMTKATTAWAVDTASKQAGMLQAMGVRVETYTKALLGNAHAQDVVNQAAGKLPAGLGKEIIKSLVGVNDQTTINNIALRVAARLEAERTTAAHKFLPTGAQLAKVYQETSGAAGAAAASTRSLQSAQEAAAASARAELSAQRALIGRLATMSALTLNIASARSAIKGLTGAVSDDGKAIRFHTVAGATLMQNLLGIADSAKAVTGTLQVQNRALGIGRAAIVSMAHSQGMSLPAARALATALGLVTTKANEIPTDKTVHVHGDTADAMRNINGVISGLAEIHDKSVWVNVNTNFTHSGVQANDTGGGVAPPKKHALGGPITGRGTKTSDSVLMYGSNGEWMVNARARDKYGDALLQQINNLSLPASGVGQGWHAPAAPMRISTPGGGGQMARNDGSALLLKEVAALRKDMTKLRVYVTNAREVATGVRSVARDEGEQAAASGAELAGISA